MASSDLGKEPVKSGTKVTNALTAKQALHQIEAVTTTRSYVPTSLAFVCIEEQSLVRNPMRAMMGKTGHCYALAMKQPQIDTE
mgnify:CR=1 FL=1